MVVVVVVDAGLSVSLPRHAPDTVMRICFACCGILCRLTELTSLYLIDAENVSKTCNAHYGLIVDDAWPFFCAISSQCGKLCMFVSMLVRKEPSMKLIAR